MSDYADKPLDEVLADLIAGGKAQIEANKKNRKIKTKNPHRKLVAQKKSNGDYETTLVDTRMDDPRWMDTFRVLLIREVCCQQCGQVQEAPNEILLLRKTHPVHGMIQESLPIHGSKHDHLPIKIERIRSNIHLCQYCITEKQLSGTDAFHLSQKHLDFSDPQLAMSDIITIGDDVELDFTTAEDLNLDLHEPIKVLH